MSIIVSLTSTSGRIPVLKYTLLSLLDQSYSPDKIVLCISKEPYLIDNGIEIVPKWLDLMEHKGQVEILWVENIGPYRKLLPVYHKANVDDLIVTCDDDVIYDTKWLYSLIQTAKANSSSIIAGRARKPVTNVFGRRQSYLNWILAPKNSKSKHLLPIGVAGIVYRKSLLDQTIMESKEFKKLAPKQDDLWFDFARQAAGTSVVIAPETDNYVYPIKTQDALSSTNASTKMTGWDRILIATLERLILKFRAYFGFSVCDNDFVIKRLNNYKRFLKYS